MSINRYPLLVHHDYGIAPSTLLIVPLLCSLFLYVSFAVSTSRRFRDWPVRRTVCWVLGITLASTAIVGTERYHHDYVSHMAAHLLLGMLAPLLLALAMPATLVLRSLHARHARYIVRLIRSKPAAWLLHPATAAVLNVGGLWVLYCTGLYGIMNESAALFLFIQFHVLAAGYLFSASMVSRDSASHRLPVAYRMFILFIALAGHDLLAKFIYANPPDGIPLEQAQAGALLMYYGGDIVDVALVVILCMEWYRKAGRSIAKEAMGAAPASSEK